MIVSDASLAATRPIVTFLRSTGLGTDCLISSSGVVRPETICPEPRHHAPPRAGLPRATGAIAALVGDRSMDVERANDDAAGTRG